MLLIHLMGWWHSKRRMTNIMSKDHLYVCQPFIRQLSQTLVFNVVHLFTMPYNFTLMKNGFGLWVQRFLSCCILFTLQILTPRSSLARWASLFCEPPSIALAQQIIPLVWINDLHQWIMNKWEHYKIMFSKLLFRLTELFFILIFFNQNKTKLLWFLNLTQSLPRVWY